MKNICKATLLITLFMTTHVTIPMNYQPMCLTDATMRECSEAFTSDILLSMMSLFWIGDHALRFHWNSKPVAWSGLVAGVAFLNKCIQDTAMDPLCMNSNAKHVATVMASAAVVISMIKYSHVIWCQAIDKWTQDPDATAPANRKKSLNSQYVKEIFNNFTQQIRWYDLPTYVVGVGLLGAIISV